MRSSPGHSTVTRARPPLIGVPVQRAPGSSARLQIPEAYPNAIQLAGGAPILLPLVGNQTILRTLYEAIDGLLLTGGGDVAVEYYGAADSGNLTYVDTRRDHGEFALTRWALADDMPVLGICRGIQVLNVAAGGTLVQDIPSERPGALIHRTPLSVAPSTLAHAVHVRSGSLLAGSLGLEGRVHDIPVNSTHHQAVADLAPGFVVSARSPDGVTEGIESRGGTFALGVQWHPERLVPGYEAMVRLFRAFVRACCATESPPS